MKKVIWFVFMILINVGFSQIPHRLEETSKVKNNIKEIKIYSRDYNGFATQYNGIQYLEKHYFYNVNGNILKVKSFSEDGEDFNERIYLYDEKEVLIKQTIINSSKYSKVSYEVLVIYYMYDEFGKLINLITTKDGKITRKEKIEYDKLNKKLKRYQNKINSDDLYLSEKYYYSNDGLLIKIEFLDETKRLISFVEYKYDANKNCISNYEDYGLIKCIDRMEYNKEGLEVEFNSNQHWDRSTAFDSLVLYQNSKTTYDKLGNKIKYEINYSNTDKSIKKFKYSFYN